MLTDIQNQIMHLLKTYRCLRNNQIASLVSVVIGCTPDLVSQQRERLVGCVCTHLLRQPTEDCTAMTGSSPDINLLAAMDVMLVFKEQGIESHRPGAPPFPLVFAKKDAKGKLRAYYVVVVRRGAEFLVSQEAQRSFRGQGNVVLFLLEDLTQAENVQFPHEHYYVIREQDGFQLYEGVVNR